jgi:hypothetical protein
MIRMHNLKICTIYRIEASIVEPINSASVTVKWQQHGKQYSLLGLAWISTCVTTDLYDTDSQPEIQPLRRVFRYWVKVPVINSGLFRYISAQNPLKLPGPLYDFFDLNDLENMEGVFSGGGIPRPWPWVKFDGSGFKHDSLPWRKLCFSDTVFDFCISWSAVYILIYIMYYWP